MRIRSNILYKKAFANHYGPEQYRENPFSFRAITAQYQDGPRMILASKSMI